jgi:hypothetical protein
MILITTMLIIGTALYIVQLVVNSRKQHKKLQFPAQELFDHNYLRVEEFYVSVFGNVPCSSYLSNADTGKVFNFISNNYGADIEKIYQSNSFNRQRNKLEFNKTVFIMANQMMIELGSSFVDIFYPPEMHHIAAEIINGAKEFEVPEKKQDFELNVITMTKDGLELKPLLVKPTSLDLNLFYNDNFIKVDELIRSRLKTNGDKGIVLLHGLPGTGKTTYLRHLIGELDKKVLFVSPNVAENMMNPEFIDLLLDNPNSVLVIEDAENILMDRKLNSYSSVSNLLNLGDGLLSDCLNAQIICTFNSQLSMIDSALMRKGRLIAKYEFDKLEIAKAQKLSDHLGFNTIISRPMTVAEITGQSEMEFDIPKMEVIGFRTSKNPVA